MSKRNYIQANKDWLEAKAKALDDAEYYENLRAREKNRQHMMILLPRLI